MDTGATSKESPADGRALERDACPDSDVTYVATHHRVDAGGLKPNTWQRFERLGSAWQQAKLGIEDEPYGDAEGDP
ncbi:MAG: hypothetical protein ACK5H2_04625, partial [Beutenbergiaceae bacterium]